MNVLAKRTGWSFKRDSWEGRQTTGAMEDSLLHWCYGGQSPSYQRFTKLSVIHEARCINVCQHTLLLLLGFSRDVRELWKGLFTVFFLKEKHCIGYKKKMDPFLNIQIFCYKKWTPYFLHRPSIVILYILSKRFAPSDVSFNVMSQCIAVLFRSVVKQVNLVTLC